MLLTMTAELSFSAIASDYEELKLNTSTLVYTNGSSSFVFTPETSGFYTLYSTGNVDTEASIYAERGDYYLDLDDDDSGENNNFKITCFLMGGIEHHIYCSNYETDEEYYQIQIERVNELNKGNIYVDIPMSAQLGKESEILKYSFVSSKKQKLYLYENYDYEIYAYIIDKDMQDSSKMLLDNNNEFKYQFEKGRNYYIYLELANKQVYDENNLNFTVFLSETDRNNESEKFEFTNEGAISLNEEKEVYLNLSENNVFDCHYYVFTPTESGYYVYSTRDNALVGTVYDDEMNVLAEDTDSGCGNDTFCIQYYFEAGKTYKLACREYSDGRGGNAFIYLTKSGYLYSKLNNENIKITSYVGLGGNVNIPESIDKYNVTAIGKDAFNRKDQITSVTIPNTVVTIEDVAFEECEGLTNITIGTNVKKIGTSAFYGCNSLKSIRIPRSVTELGTNIIGKCSSISNITVDENNSVYDSRNNCNAIIETATNTLVSGCQETTIPINITKIGNRAFYALTSLENILLPDSIKIIDKSAFAYCENLTEITIPSNVSSIEPAAFSSCSKLEKINITEGVKNIGDWAFAYCYSLKSINIPKSVTIIGSDAFFWCSQLRSITIKNPNCDIVFLGYLCNDDNNDLVSIYADTNSTAQDYVKNHENFKFISTGTATRCSNHQWKTITLEEATCVDIGFSKSTCSKCGYILRKEIPATGKHTISSIKIVKNPTTTSTGIRKYTCKICGEEITESIPKLAKKANTITVKAKKPTIKYSKLKKKNQTIAVKKAMTVSKAKGKVTYTLSSAKKGKKSFKKYFKVNSKTGKITVKKNLKKGTYKVKIKVKAAGNATYKAASKTITVTIKVK